MLEGIFMNNDLWSKFEKSGMVTDYLRYKGYFGSDKNDNDYCQRNSNQGTSVR